MDWLEVTAHLSGLAHMATATPDGTPHVSMVSPAVEGHVIWIGTRKSSGKARNLSANPRAALMWTPRAEAYVFGDVELVDDVAEKQRVWSADLFGYDMAMFWGSPENPDFVLLKVHPHRATVLVQGDAGLQRLRWDAGHPTSVASRSS
jgi:general stress protein 26